MDIIGNRVHAEVTCPYIGFQGRAAIGGEIQEGACTLIFGDNHAASIPFGIQNHKIRSQPSCDASGQGDAVRRQGKIKVVREAVPEHISYCTTYQVNFLIWECITDFINERWK